MLQKPEKFNHPSCDSCSEVEKQWGCQLHLHGPSSWRATEGTLILGFRQYTLRLTSLLALLYQGICYAEQSIRPQQGL